MPFTALVVDDEPLAREGLSMLLSRDPDIETVHLAKNGVEAVSAIRTRRPDLVFLDVQMPDMDGMSVVKEIGGDAMPPVVFVTAHDRYAIQAFELNAIDYLLKPVTEERFGRALERVKARRRTEAPGDAERQMLFLLESLAKRARYVERLAVRSTGKTVLVAVCDIDWMGAAENYVELHIGKSTQLLLVTMNTLEKSLDPELFMRVHRSTIVNTRRIREIKPAQHGEYLITLQDGTRLQSGRVFSDRVRALVSNPF